MLFAHESLELNSRCRAISATRSEAKPKLSNPFNRDSTDKSGNFSRHEFIDLSRFVYTRIVKNTIPQFIINQILFYSNEIYVHLLENNAYIQNVSIAAKYAT